MDCFCRSVGSSSIESSIASVAIWSEQVKHGGWCALTPERETWNKLSGAGLCSAKPFCSSHCNELILVGNFTYTGDPKFCASAPNYQQRQCLSRFTLIFLGLGINTTAHRTIGSPYAVLGKPREQSCRIFLVPQVVHCNGGFYEPGGPCNVQLRFLQSIIQYCLCA